MPKYQFGNDTLDFKSDDDAIRYAKSVGATRFKPVASEAATPKKYLFGNDTLNFRSDEEAIKYAKSIGATRFKPLPDEPAPAPPPEPDPAQEDPKAQAEYGRRARSQYDDERQRFVAIRSDLLAKLKKDNPNFTGNQSQLVEIASRGAKRKMGIPEATSFDNIHDWVRTKAGGQERTGIMGALETAGTALMEGPIGKEILTPAAAFYFGKEGETEESRTGRELMQIEDAAKIQSEMDAFKKSVDDRVKANAPVSPEEKARYDELKKAEKLPGMLAAMGKSIPQMVKEIKENPGDAMRELGFAMLDPREIAIVLVTAPISAGIGGALERAPMMAQRAAQAAVQVSRRRKLATEAVKFAGETIAQGSLSEAARTGANTPEEFAGNIVMGAGMAGAVRALARGTRAGKAISRRFRGRQLPDAETHVPPEVASFEDVAASLDQAATAEPPMHTDAIIYEREKLDLQIQEKAKQIAEIESTRRKSGLDQARQELMDLHARSGELADELARRGQPAEQPLPFEPPPAAEPLPPDAPVAPEATPVIDAAPIPDAPVAPEATPVIDAALIPDAPVAQAADPTVPEPPPSVARRRAAKKKTESVDPKAAKKQRADVEKEAKAFAKAGDAETAKQMIDDAAPAYEATNPDMAQQVMDRVKSEMDAQAPKPEIPKIERASSIEEANANAAQGMEKIAQAATEEEVIAIANAYEQPFKDAGKPRLAKKAVEKAIQRIRQAPAEAPVAPVDAAPAPAPEPPRRAIQVGNKVQELPSPADAAARPANSASDVLLTFADPDQMARGKMTLSRAVRDGIAANVTNVGTAKRVIDMLEKLVRSFSGEGMDRGALNRMDYVDMMSQREDLIDAGDEAALRQFDSDNLLDQLDRETGVPRLQEAMAKGQLSPVEWGVIDAAMNLLSKDAPDPMPSIPQLEGAIQSLAPLIASLHGIPAENVQQAISMFGAPKVISMAIKAAAERLQKSGGVLIDDLDRVVERAKATGNKAAYEAGRFLAETTRRLVYEARVQEAQFYTSLRRIRNKIPAAVWRKEMKDIADIMEGKSDGSKNDPRILEYAQEFRKILDAMRAEYADVSGRIGRDNYVPRILDMEKVGRVVSAIHNSLDRFRDASGRKIDASAFDSPTTSANAGDAAGAFDPAAEIVIESMVKDLKKWIKVGKDGKIEVDMGADSDIPGSLLIRPEDGKGGFLPSHLPEIFDGIEGSDGVTVNKSKDWTPQKLDAQLRREAVRQLLEAFDPDDMDIPMLRKSPRAAKSRRWQLDGSLIHRRMMPDMGPGMYVTDIEDMAAHIINRQTRGIKRLKYFGDRKDGNVQHKVKMENALKTLAQEIPPEELGLTRDASGVRLKASDERGYKGSLLNSLDDAAMGYLRPFTEMNWLWRMEREGSKIARMLVMTTGTLNAARNEAQSGMQAIGVGGGRGGREFASARATVANQLVPELSMANVGNALAGIDRATTSFIPGVRVATGEIIAKLRNTPIYDYYLSRGAGDASGMMGRSTGERFIYALENTLGAFGPSNTNVDITATVSGVELGLLALKDVKQMGRSRITQAYRKAMGDSPEGEWAEWLRRTIPDDKMAEALDLVDDKGTPISRQAFDQLMDILGPFVDDWRSKVTGSSEALLQSKLLRGRGMKAFIGNMAAVPIAISMRMMADVAREPTIPRKVRRVARQTTGVLGAGLGMTAIAANPFQSALAAAALNGAVTPAIVGAMLMGYAGTGGEQYKRDSEKRAELELGMLAHTISTGDDIIGSVARLARTGVPYAWMGTQNLADVAFGVDENTLRSAAIMVRPPEVADLLKITTPAFSVPANAIVTGTRRAMAKENAGDRAMALASGLFPAAVGTFTSGKYDAALRGTENRVHNQIQAFPGKAAAYSSPIAPEALRLGVQTKIDRATEGR
jgi:hypothetical protein